MKKIILKNKIILALFILVISISSIYYFLFSEKKNTFFCSGKNFTKADDYELWIFDTKNKLAYKGSTTAVPVYLEIYSDMYRFIRSNGEITLEYKFYKVPELLTIRGTMKGTSFNHLIQYKCQKKS